MAVDLRRDECDAGGARIAISSSSSSSSSSLSTSSIDTRVLVDRRERRGRSSTPLLAATKEDAEGEETDEVELFDDGIRLVGEATLLPLNCCCVVSSNELGADNLRGFMEADTGSRGGAYDPGTNGLFVELTNGVIFDSLNVASICRKGSSVARLALRCGISCCDVCGDCGE